MALFSSRCAWPLAADFWAHFTPCDAARLGVVASEGSAAEMLAILRRTHWPSPFRHLALCSLVVADELLELFSLVLESNRFRPEQLPACEQRPRQRNHLNLSAKQPCGPRTQRQWRRPLSAIRRLPGLPLAPVQPHPRPSTYRCCWNIRSLRLQPPTFTKACPDR